jgi:thiamine kinase
VKPEQVAAEVLKCDASQLHSERIKRGLTNESWRVQGGGHDVIVRISTADEHALQLDRLSEARVLSIVEQAGIGPQVLLCAPQSRLLVTQTLPGHDWDEQAAREPSNIVRLAALMRRLHALPVAAGIRTIDLVAMLRGYWLELDAQPHHLNEQQVQQRTHALQLAQALPLEVQQCLCHTDLHHFNIVDNGERLWILDWEYAGIGDPYFDLASVCCWHRYDAALRHALLLEYFDEVSEQSELRLAAMCWLFDYIKELWFAVRGQ